MLDQVDTPVPARRAAALRYPGAKWSLAPAITARFPTHYHYLEPFFGSGAVYFTKPPSPHEIINDADGRVVNFFRVLRNHTDDLVWALETTPWSRDEYDQSHAITGDPVEDARRFTVRTWQAHASDHAKKTGWKTRGATQRARGMSDRWRRVPPELADLAERLKDAEIEHRPALDVIARHDTADTLIYADPPYLPSTRTQAMYAHEMAHDDHVALLAALRNHPGPVVLSGYANTLYDTQLATWERVTLTPPKVQKGAHRIEVLWIKD